CEGDPLFERILFGISRLRRFCLWHRRQWLRLAGRIGRRLLGDQQTARHEQRSEHQVPPNKWLAHHSLYPAEENTSSSDQSPNRRGLHQFSARNRPPTVVPPLLLELSARPVPIHQAIGESARKSSSTMHFAAPSSRRSAEASGLFDASAKRREFMSLALE